LTLLKRYLTRVINDFPHPDGSVNADVNGDGKINSTDYSAMIRYILRIIDSFLPKELRTKRHKKYSSFELIFRTRYSKCFYTWMWNVYIFYSFFYLFHGKEYV